MESQTETVKTLAEAVSAQASLTNRIWLATMAVALATLLPQSGEGDIELLFNLGSVSQPLYYPVMFAILATLIVTLAVAHAQVVRADKAAHGVIDGLAPENSGIGDLSARELFDLLRVPSLTRVAPLAQTVAHRQATYLAPTVYLVLKILVLVVLFVLPGVALGFGFVRVLGAGVPVSWLVVLSLVGFFAFFSLFVATVTDARYVWRIAGIIWEAGIDGPD